MRLSYRRTQIKIVNTIWYSFILAVDFHCEHDLSPFCSKRSKIIHFRPENDSNPRVGQADQNRAFRDIPKIASSLNPKKKIEIFGWAQMPRKYCEQKMSPFVDTRRKRAGGRPPPLQNVLLPIANGPAKWLYQIQSLSHPLARPPAPTKTARVRCTVLPRGV